MAKKKAAKKKTFISKHLPHPDSSSNLDKMLLDNFVALQKVMTNLAVKLDNVANQISKLVELFEISAKSLAEKGVNTRNEEKETKEILKKLDTLADQNKVIAKGLTMMHDKIPGEPIQQTISPAQSPPQNTGAQMQTQNIRPLPSDQYYRSISDQKRPPMPGR